ncbi:hypothetical protein [Arhodomonas sp. AD133]|uniref:hypothetical protein n=1 Tax=Arhodomonas sp. AD133 TaxID=3415009 RepID=UPI003EB854E5
MSSPVSAHKALFAHSCVTLPRDVRGGPSDRAPYGRHDALVRALAHMVADEDAATVPVLEAGARRHWAGLAEACRYEPATPVVGSGGRRVWQAFGVCRTVPGVFDDLAGAVAVWLDAARRELQPAPFPSIAFNELILQRYVDAAYGITPHRDHRRYRYLVAVLVLSGQGRFLVCDDRAGRGARQVAAQPGELILMRAPGFAASERRPFHAVVDVSGRRLTLAMRYGEGGAE